MSKKPTLKDVAHEAHVSTATVARVLHGRGFVSKEARKQVDEAIQKTGYRLNFLAQSLRQQRTKTIGHLLTSISPNPFFAGVELGVENEAIQNGYSVLIWNVFEDPKREVLGVETFVQRQVDAIIFTTPIDPKNVETALSAQIPVIQVERPTKVQSHKVLVDNSNRASGVVTADGETIQAKIVISNINARKLYLDMIGEEYLRPLARKGIKSYHLSKSTPYICLGVDYDPPLDAHHTLVTRPVEEINEFWYEKYRIGTVPTPEEQFGLICCPTKTDPTVAPEGHHIVALDFQGPSKLASGTWDDIKEEFSEDLITHLSKTIIPGLKEHVKTKVVTTPLDFERRLLNPGGAFYCFQQDLTAQVVFRPSSKSKSISNLYLTGASTHPGGGVPTVMASGIIAANLIDQNEK